MDPSDPGDPKRTVADGTLGYEERETEDSRPPPQSWRALLTDAAGTFEARYETHEEIGRGGVGRVLLVDDRLMGRSVAMKALHEGSEGSRGYASRVRRFFAEAQTTAQLEHPNVVPVYELGEQPDGAPYFSGGYSTREHGSIGDGELVSGIQIEHHFGGIRDTDANRRAYAERLARVIRDFMLEHIGYFEPTTP